MNVLANEVDPGARRFPKGFLWGCGTSSYQIEGAVEEDGRGKSIWDVFCHTPGKVQRGTPGTSRATPTTAWSDLELLTELGVDAYRFSISWPRVQPDGAVRSTSAASTTTARSSTSCAAARSCQSSRSITGSSRRRSRTKAAGPPGDGRAAWLKLATVIAEGARRQRRHVGHDQRAQPDRRPGLPGRNTRTGT